MMGNDNILPNLRIRISANHLLDCRQIPRISHIVHEIKIHKSILLPHFPIANSFQDTKATYGFLNRRESEEVELIDTASLTQ